jgi:hypothetical protein
LQPASFSMTVSATTYQMQPTGFGFNVAGFNQTLVGTNQTLDVFLIHTPTVSTFHVTGIATDEEGAPVPGATITFSGSRAPFRFSTVTDSRGFYRVDFQATHVGRTYPAAQVDADSPGHQHFCDYVIPASYDDKDQNISEDVFLYRMKYEPTGCDSY